MPKNAKTNDILYGVHPVISAITAKRREMHCVYIAGPQKHKKRHQQIAALALHSKIRVEKISATDMAAMTGTELHQGVAARTGAYPFIALDELCLTSSGGHLPFLLIIDGVTDTHNLGALVRTAVCAGVTGIVIPKNNAASPTPAASKTSAGALEIARLAMVTNIARTIDFLKENGVWIAGLAADAAQSIYEADLAGSIALVVGGEGKGMRRLVKKKCDFSVAIPQAGAVDSLNVSVAGGIAMYELYRQRGILSDSKRKQH